MAKIVRDSKTGQFVVRSDKRRGAVIEEIRTKRDYSLKGYGSLKDEYSVKREIDITKPISGQTMKKGTKRKK